MLDVVVCKTLPSDPSQRYKIEVDKACTFQRAFHTHADPAKVVCSAKQLVVRCFSPACRTPTGYNPWTTSPSMGSMAGTGFKPWGLLSPPSRQPFMQLHRTSNPARVWSVACTRGVWYRFLRDSPLYGARIRAVQHAACYVQGVWAGLPPCRCVNREKAASSCIAWPLDLWRQQTLPRPGDSDELMGP